MGCCVGRTSRKKIDPVSYEQDGLEIITKETLRQPPVTLEQGRREERVRVHLRVDRTYKMYSAIGKGAFGHVIRAEHKETKKPYAIKIIELRGDAEREKKSEIEILGTVDHPYVIKLHEVISTPRKLYLVMDLATGGELFDRIYQVGYFCENDATRVLRMILEGIQYLHSLGITHRDLKPENILYYHPGQDSRIIITDFGLAAISKCPATTLMNTDCGTVEYMAPEVIVRDPYTNAVDMWSVGVITYILLSGKLPFPIKGNVYSLLRSICHGRYNYEDEPWNKISSDAKSFIDSLLVIDQTRRLTASEALQHIWMKKRQSRKRNLQRSISSNWTDSCHSLSKPFSNANINPRRHDTKRSGTLSPKVSGNFADIDNGVKLSTDSQCSKPSSRAQRKCYQKMYVSEPGIPETRPHNKTNQHYPKKDDTERSALNKHVAFVSNQTTQGIGVLPPLKNPTTPISIWNEASQLR